MNDITFQQFGLSTVYTEMGHGEWGLPNSRISVLSLFSYFPYISLFVIHVFIIRVFLIYNQADL